MICLYDYLEPPTIRSYCDFFVGLEGAPRTSTPLNSSIFLTDTRFNNDILYHDCKRGRFAHPSLPLSPISIKGSFSFLVFLVLLNSVVIFIELSERRHIWVPMNSNV